LTQDKILELTDRQFHEVYFHKRAKDGTIEIPMPAVESPEGSATEESEYQNLAFLKNFPGCAMTDEEYQRLRQEIADKYHGKEHDKST
jgi:hypothetical protein